MHPITPEQFLRDVRDHELTILREDANYRHLRLSKTGTSCMRFDLITWPGYLCYSGDMGTYVFTRVKDMFDFFRRKDSDRWHQIDMRYWAEKCAGIDRDGIQEFSEEKFNRAVTEYLVRWIRGHRDHTSKDERRALWGAVAISVLGADGNPGGYRKMCAAHDFSHQVNQDTNFYFQDFYEASVEEYTHRFVWCCYAIAWGIQQYDRESATANRQFSSEGNQMPPK